MTQATASVIEMMEKLPEAAQDQVVERIREIILDLEDDLLWDETFKRTQPQLKKLSEEAWEEIRQGRAKPMNLDDL